MTSQSQRVIHATAVVDPRAELGEGVVVGPHAVIDAGVVVGRDCRIGPHVHLAGPTTIGAGNTFYSGCVIGGDPQDFKYKGDPTRLVIGDHNVFREHVTVSRSNRLDEDTVIGSHNLLMANSHVGHNASVGNHVILANGALVAGHARIADRVFLSGTCLVHQFTRIGTLALMRGGAGISQDLPPFCIARGENRICGLNVIGLRRAGIAPGVRLELRRVYLQLFRGRGLMKERIATLRPFLTSPEARHLVDFVAESRRGVCSDSGRRSAEPDDEE